MKHKKLRVLGLCLLIYTCACGAAEHLRAGPLSKRFATTVTSLAVKDTRWRTANWNICQTSLSDAGTRPECRAKINPTDSSRTASAVERLAIGNLLLERNMYSFSLQEVCERDVRWIAAYVANNGNVSRDGTFSPRQYVAIDSLAPYAFLPYLTAEMLGEDEDHGCGPGVSTGIAVVVKSEAGAPAPRIRGLANADYLQRLHIPLTYIHDSACAFYFDAQGSRATTESDKKFRVNGCSSRANLDTLRGLACVQTTWRASVSETPLRATSCSTHIIGRDQTHLVPIADLQLKAAGNESVVFSENGRVMLAGDFNDIGHQQVLEGLTHPLRKVTQGPTHRFRCASEIDGIYVRGWNYSAPSTTHCQVIDRAEPEDLNFGDFNGDGVTDVFHRDSSGQWRFSPGGNAQWQNLNRSGVDGNELAFGDFDGDGMTDVFHRDSNGQDGQWRYSSGGIYPWENLNRSVVPGSELGFGDFDGDGRTDVFHRHASGQWRYSSGGVDPWTNLAQASAPWHELHFGDFDGDDVADIFHRDYSDSKHQWRFSSGGVGPWENLSMSSIPHDQLRFHDFDGDGVTDVFWANGFGIWRYSSGGRTSWVILESAIVPLDPAAPFTWSDHAMSLSPLLTPAPRPKLDFDRDGVIDVFHRHWGGPQSVKPPSMKVLLGVDSPEV